MYQIKNIDFNVFSKKQLLFISLLAISVLFNTQIMANFGDCGFNGAPSSIDEASEAALNTRMWLDSPILRCFDQFKGQESLFYYLKQQSELNNLDNSSISVQ